MRGSLARASRMCYRLENKYQSIAFFFIALSGLVMLLISTKNGNTKLVGFVALAFLIVITLVFPFAGFILSLPVFIVIFFDNNKQVWEWWNKVKTSTLRRETSK
jgi:hypothetical protein